MVFAGISALVALGSAIASGVAWWNARNARDVAEARRDEAVAAASKVASATDRIAAAQESRQTAEESAQASSVVLVLSEAQRGFSGWRVQNDSNQPVTNVVVRGAAGEPIVVYLGSGPEQRPDYVEHTVGAYQRSPLMFRPTGTDAVHATSSDIDRMALRFTDARQQTWEKIGRQSARRAGP